MRLRSGLALTVLSFAVALTASGCSGADPAPAPTVTVTVTPSPTASADPTDAPTPAIPDADSYDPADPGTWLVSLDGIGPMRLGGTLPALQTELGLTPETCRAGVDSYSLDGLAYTAVSGIDESDPQAPIVAVRSLAVDSFDPSAAVPRTAEGIGVGSTVEELQAAYPMIETYQNRGGETVYRVSGDESTINFEPIGSDQVVIVTVTTSAEVASEYCGA
ncbi:hypothetical protein [Herbiconiux sp. A18JL235]|uniref:Uncharacterized protein n=1 Tax=Herbiconiux sp. A18JL235 TaxID=3152363 RepID=A0AB39BJD4_9MICO